ncbi:MAG: NUDIX hydrolase [Puniceicoccales bacterium]|jgi:8-oxo-dGTP pyrophosphatase MutT (NUDIX family)|nr:NUDIX hydrolase [Puniceicoccales bacterium]
MDEILQLISHIMEDEIPSRWILTNQKSVFSCPIFQLLKKKYIHPTDRRSGDFYAMDIADWVQVVAFTTENKLILVQQFRFGIEIISLETPGGLIEKNEDPIAAGLRELREETGYVPENAYLLTTFYPNPAIQTNRLYIVIAENCQKIDDQHLDPNEEITCYTATFSECLEKIKSGKINHAIAIATLLTYQLLRSATP